MSAGSRQKRRLSTKHCRLNHSGLMPTISEVNVATTPWYPSSLVDGIKASAAIPADRGSFFSGGCLRQSISVNLYDACRNPIIEGLCLPDTTPSDKHAPQRNEEDGVTAAGDVFSDALGSSEESSDSESASRGAEGGRPILSARRLWPNVGSQLKSSYQNRGFQSPGGDTSPSEIPLDQTRRKENACEADTTQWGETVETSRMRMTNSAEGLLLDAQVLSASLSDSESYIEEEPPGKCQTVRADTKRKEADLGTHKKQEHVRNAAGEAPAMSAPAESPQDVSPPVAELASVCRIAAPPTEFAGALRAELKQLVDNVTMASKGAATWTGDSAKEVRDDQDRIQADSVGLLAVPVRSLSLDSEILTPWQLRATQSDARQSPGVQAHSPASEETPPTAKRFELFSSPIISPPSFPNGKKQAPAAECIREGDGLILEQLGKRHAKPRATPGSEPVGSAGQARQRTSDKTSAAKSLHRIILGDYFETAEEAGAESDTEALESPRGSLRSIDLDAMSPDQLADEIKRRQEGLAKLITFYTAWGQKVGQHAEGDTGRKPGEIAAGTAGELGESEIGAADSPGSLADTLDAASDLAFSEISTRTADLSDSEPDSFGSFRTLHYPSGGCYHGSVSMFDKPDGLGRYETKSQAGEEVADLYEGEFCSGLMEGYGVYYFENCGWYSGQWTKGKQQGYGKQIFANGTMCLGQFGRSGRLDGCGVCLYPSGDIYEGEFKNGIPHGRGYHKAADDSEYAGSFVHGRRRGIGVYYFSNGDRFAGTFDSDHPSGHGTYVAKTHERLEGQFRCGQVHGWGVRIFPDGPMAAGKWCGGKLQWSRVLVRDVDNDDLLDADAEGLDIAQEIARNARHSALLAERAAANARYAPKVSEAVRHAMDAANQADAASKLVARLSQR